MYVDDTILAIPKEKGDLILQCFNSYHDKLKFKTETEENRKITILDIDVLRDGNGILLIHWYTNIQFQLK